MLLDNSGNNTVFEWLQKYTETGEMDIVTGYFTVGALSWLSRRFNDKINRFRFVTDLNEDRLSEKMDYRTGGTPPKLFVIDESHNRRNDMGSRGRRGFADLGRMSGGAGWTMGAEELF